jgi:hypothetical protein
MKSVVLMFLVEMCFPVCVIGAVECQRTAVLQLKNSASSSEKVPLWTLQRPQETAFFFRSGVTIDADGAPKAYHPSAHRVSTPSVTLASPGIGGRW